MRNRHPGLETREALCQWSFLATWLPTDSIEPKHNSDAGIARAGESGVAGSCSNNVLVALNACIQLYGLPQMAVLLVDVGEGCELQEYE